MTSDHAFKKAVRAFAAEQGIPYSQARRDYPAFLGRVLDEVENLHPSESCHVTFQQASRDDLSRPFPFTVDVDGIVVPQAFWRGDPFLLVGFVTDPDTMRVDLHREEFLDDPEKAVGMHPVMANGENRWTTFRGAVESVSPRLVTVTPRAAVHADFAVTTPDGTRAARIPVGHLFDHLSDEDLVEMRKAGWDNVGLVSRLLTWAARAGDARALDLEEHAATWEADEFSVEGYVDADEAEAWLEGRGAVAS